MIDRGKAATFELGERDERSLEGSWPLSLEQETRSMTAHPIDLVQSSFAKVTPIADTAAVIFYDRLFEIAPEVRPLFNGDMAEQRRRADGDARRRGKRSEKSRRGPSGGADARGEACRLRRQGDGLHRPSARP